MEKWLSCFSCVTAKEQEQRNHTCSSEGTLLRGPDNCSTLPTSRQEPSALNIKHTSQLELAMRYGHSIDAVLVLACSRVPMDTDTDGTLCELEPVYCNLSAIKMFGLPVSVLSDGETYEVATEVLNAIGKKEPALLQDAREHLCRLVCSDLPGNRTVHITSRKYPEVISPQTFPTRLTEHAQDAAAVSSLPKAAPAPVDGSIQRPWKHVSLESVMYELSGMPAGNANDVVMTSLQPTSTEGNLQRSVVQHRQSLLSRYNIRRAGSVEKKIKNINDQASDSTTLLVLPAVIVLFQLHLHRPSQPHSSSRSPDIPGYQQVTGGSFRPFSPISALPTDSSIHGVMNDAALPAPQATCDSPCSPSDTGLPDAAACERSGDRADHDTMHRELQQLHRQDSRTPILQHQPPLIRRGGSAWSATKRRAAHYKILAAVVPPADGRSVEATTSASATATASVGSWAGFGATVTAATTAAELAPEAVASSSSSSSSSEGERSLETSFLRRRSSSLPKNIADCFRAREGMVLSGLTPVVTAFGGPRCMEVLYQNATSILYFGLRGQPTTENKDCPATKAEEGGSSQEGGALVELFFFEPTKLERLLNEVLTEGRVWRGIVQVPATCHSRLTRLQRAQQTMSVRRTTAQSSSTTASLIIQTATTIQSPAAVRNNINRPEPPTQQQLPELPILSVGIRLAKSPPHVQGSDATNPQELSLKEAAASPAVPTPTATHASLMAEYAGSIDTNSTMLSTADGLTPATIMATADVEPLRKALGNSEMDPLATSTWGLLIDSPELTTHEFSRRTATDAISGFVSAAGVPYKSNKTNSGAAAAAALNGSSRRSVCKASSVLTLRERSGGFEANASIISQLLSPSAPPQGSSSIAPIGQSASTSVKRDAATAPIPAPAPADKRPPPPMALVSRYSHAPPISRCDGAAAANSASHGCGGCGSGGGGSCLDSSMSRASYSVVGRIVSMVDLNPHHRSSYSIGAPRQCHSRAELGPQDFSGRTVPRVLTFASTLRSTPSAAQVALQAAMANSLSVSSRWSVLEPPPPLPTSRAAAAAPLPLQSRYATRSGGCFQDFSTATEHDLLDGVTRALRYNPGGPAPAMERAKSTSVVTKAETLAAAVPFGSVNGRHRTVPLQLAFRNPRSWTSNGLRLKDFVEEQEDEQLCIEPCLKCQISGGIIYPDELRATVTSAAETAASLGSNQKHIAYGCDSCDVGFGGCNRTATVRGGLNNGHHDGGRNSEVAAASDGLVKERVIGTMTSGLRGGNREGAAVSSEGSDAEGCEGDDFVATYGDMVEATRRPVPTATAAPSPAVQVTTAAGTCWHEICASRTTDPLTGQHAIIVTQTDVTGKVEAERHLAFVTEAEHRLLEQIFPRHVLAYMTEEGGPWAVGPTPTAHPHPGMSDTMSGYWRPMVRDINKLATSHDQVTLLFADIQGFTPMCKVLEPRVVMAFLNDLFTRFDSRLDEFGVYKVETIGDCYFVAGGLICQDEHGMPAVRALDGPADPQHAKRVFSFAKTMLRAASEMSLPTTGGEIKMRIGLHSGPVVSGVVGQRMPRFCLFGDTVNTASRMESTGVPGCIHVSEATQNLLGGEDWVPTGGIEVKGKGRMNTYVWTPPDQKPDNSSVAASVTTTAAAAAAVMTAAAAATAVRTAAAAATAASVASTTVIAV